MVLGLITSIGSLLWIVGINQCSGATWTYTNTASNPDKWSSSFAACGADRQSPIAITHLEATPSSELNPARIFLKPSKDLTNLKYTLTNNGHTVKITIPADTWFVTFKTTNIQQFEVAQIHLHWGSDIGRGSEHSLNGKSFELETHVVTFNTQLFDDLLTAAGSPDGLAVLGFLNQLTPNVADSVTHLHKLGLTAEQLSKLENANSAIDIPAFHLDYILQQVNPGRYYRYAGSLTTPMCTPNVIWTVFSDPVPISQSQLTALRSLKYQTGESQLRMSDNFRPTQNINPVGSMIPRTVYYSGSNLNGETACPKMSPFVVLIFIGLSQFF